MGGVRRLTVVGGVIFPLVGGVRAPAAPEGLQLPVEHPLGFLTLGPGEAPLLEAPPPPQMPRLLPHFLEASIREGRVLEAVLLQAANHSLAFVWQLAVLHSDAR